MMGILGQLIQTIEQNHLVRLHRPSGEEDVLLTFEDRYLWQGFRDRHRRRTIHDDSQCPFGPVLAEQHDGLPKIWIAQGRCCDQEDAFCKWSFHKRYPTSLL